MAERLRNYNYIIIGAALVVLIQSCGIGQLVTGQTAEQRKEQRKCNQAAKRVDRAVRLCPTMASTKTALYMVPIPAKSVEGSTDRNQVLIQKIIEQHAYDGPIENIIERLIYERCFEEDTVRLDLWDAKIKLWFQDGLLRHKYERNASEIPFEAPIMDIAPTKTAPRSLAWWQIALMVLGAVTIWKSLVWVFQGFANRG